MAYVVSPRRHAPRVVQYTEKQAKEAHEDGVDLLEEARE
jgi:hypothetical protein